MTDFEQRGVRMRAGPREYTQRRIFYGAHEPGEVAALRRLLRPGDAVIDVGAHVGFFTLLAADAVGPDGAVHAFEPVHENFRNLAVNVDLNGFEHVVLNRVAVGREVGHVQLGTSAEAGSNTGGFTVGRSGPAADGREHHSRRLRRRSACRVVTSVSSRSTSRAPSPHVLAGFAGHFENGRRTRSSSRSASTRSLRTVSACSTSSSPSRRCGYPLFRIRPRGAFARWDADLEAPPRPPADGPTRGAIKLDPPGSARAADVFQPAGAARGSGLSPRPGDR